MQWTARIARSDVLFVNGKREALSVFAIAIILLRKTLICFENRNGEKYLTRSLMISAPHPILFGSSNGEE